MFYRVQSVWKLHLELLRKSAVLRVIWMDWTSEISRAGKMSMSAETRLDKPAFAFDCAIATIKEKQWNLFLANCAKYTIWKMVFFYI